LRIVGFAALLSQISEFRFQYAVVDDESRKRLYRIEGQSLQQNRTLGLLQREIWDLRAMHLLLAAESVSLGQTNQAFEQSICLQQIEVADLRGAHARRLRH
jgi:hypothetical protein